MEKTYHILIAEDEKPMATALKLKLENEGFTTTIVFDGEQALEALGKESFDVVLLDLMMPKVDGFGVLEALQQFKYAPPVIVSSNLGQPEDQEHAKKLGAIDFFVKSDTPINHVVEHITKVIEDVQKEA